MTKITDKTHWAYQMTRADIHEAGLERAKTASKEQIKEYLKNAILMDDKEEVKVFKHALKVWDQAQIDKKLSEAKCSLPS